jgi:hypothetical protein
MGWAIIFWIRRIVRNGRSKLARHLVVLLLLIMLLLLLQLLLLLLLLLRAFKRADTLKRRKITQPLQH